MTITRTENDHIVPSHHAGYWSAQRRGFELLTALEAATKEVQKQSIESVVLDNDGMPLWEAPELQTAIDHRSDIAELASYGMALSIIDAQRRDDKIARLIRLRRCWHDNDYVPY